MQARPNLLSGSVPDAGWTARIGENRLSIPMLVQRTAMVRPAWLAAVPTRSTTL